jgi:hypothetical protein
MNYELDRRPSATHPPCFQPEKGPLRVSHTVRPDVDLSPLEWVHHHARAGRAMQLPGWELRHKR